MCPLASVRDAGSKLAKEEGSMQSFIGCNLTLREPTMMRVREGGGDGVGRMRLKDVANMLRDQSRRRRA